MRSCRLHNLTNSSDGWCKRSKCNTAASSNMDSSRVAGGGGGGMCWVHVIIVPQHWLNHNYLALCCVLCDKHIVGVVVCTDAADGQHVWKVVHGNMPGGHVLGDVVIPLYVLHGTP